MSSTTGMSDIETAKSTADDDKVNWFAEFRGLLLMLQRPARRRSQSRDLAGGMLSCTKW